MRETFPQGYLACQFMRISLTTPASMPGAACRRVAAATAWGWRCSGPARRRGTTIPRCMKKLMRRLPPGSVRSFSVPASVDICALIAASSGVVGSSLHGRIVALAYGLPRVSLMPAATGGRHDKRMAFAETWEPALYRAAWPPARSNTQ